MALNYLGMHGTCRSYADLILKNGFNPGHGRHGVGVYFWESSVVYPPIYNLSIELSKCFYNDRLSSFQNENDPSLAILSADINLSNQLEILDFEEMEISTMFCMFMDKNRSIKTTSRNDKEAKKNSSIFLLAFIKMIESLRNCNIQVLRVKTQAPSTYRQALSRTHVFLGMERQSCFVVRNSRIITNIKKVS